MTGLNINISDHVICVGTLPTTPPGRMGVKAKKKKVPFRYLPTYLPILSFFLSRLYTEYVGLGIPVDSAVALRTVKTAMLVPNCTGAYGGKAFFRPFRVIGSIH